MAGHFLALPDLAWILAITSRAVTTVRDRHTVTSAQTGETVSFHRARKPFTDALTDNINMLARHKMLDRQLCADIQNRIFANTEFDQLTPRFHFRLGEMAAHRLGRILHLRGTNTELDGVISVFLFRPHRDDMTPVDF